MKKSQRVFDDETIKDHQRLRELSRETKKEKEKKEKPKSKL